MGRGIRKARYLSEIRSVAELREARRELELREWFTRERLIADVHATFSFDNLLSIVAPPGSLVERVIGGIGSGISVAQGVMGAIRSLIGGIGVYRQASSAKARNHVSGHTPGHTTKTAATRAAKAPAAPARAAKTRTAPTRKKV